MLTILHTSIFIGCIPLSLFIMYYLKLYDLYNLVCDKFHPYFCDFGSGDDSLLQIFLFWIIPAWVVFTIFYFSVQFITKYINNKVDMKKNLKNYALNTVSITIFLFMLFGSIDISKIISEWIRRIWCSVISADFCNYSIPFLSFPKEKSLYLIIPLWFLIVIFFIYVLYKIYLFKRIINDEKPKMKYYYLTFLVVVFLIPLYMFISIFPFGKKEIGEIKNMSNEELIIYANNTKLYNLDIEEIIETLNYCEIKEDCESFHWEAPFSCNQVVNKENTETAKTLITNVRNKYNWGWQQYCTTLPDVKCENNKCIFEEN